MSSHPLRQRRSPLHFEEGVLIYWSPILAGRMLWRGVEIGTCTMPRKEVARRIWEVFKAWFDWTTALPGDRFWDFQRDLIIEVAHGTPSRRTARVVTGMALSYPLVQKLGVGAVFAHAPVERCNYTWGEVGSWRR